MAAHFDELLRARPGLRLEPLATSIGPDSVFVDSRLRATVEGEPVTWECVDRFNLHNGAAVEDVAYLHPADIGMGVAS